MSTATLSLARCGILSCKGLKDLAKYQFVEMHLENNELTNLEDFGTHPDLQVLHMENNNISTFVGLTKQKALQELFLKGNPITDSPLYRVMALLTIGFSIQVIDGRRIEPAEREMARYLGPTAALAVSYGWILDGTPKTPNEFEAIITKLRNDRRIRLQEVKEIGFRTVADAVLATRAASTAVSTTSLNTNDETNELQRKALSYLSERSKALEENLRQAQRRIEELEQQKSVPTRFGVLPKEQTQAQQLSLVGIAPLEVQLFETIVMNPPDGIFLQTTHQLPIPSQKAPLRVVVQFERMSIRCLTFFAREVLIELPLKAIDGVNIDTIHRSIMLRSEGGIHLLTVPHEGSLLTLLKLVHFRQGTSLPDLLPDGFPAELISHFRLSQSETQLRANAAPVPTKSFDDATSQTEQNPMISTPAAPTATKVVSSSHAPAPNTNPQNTPEHPLVSTSNTEVSPTFQFQHVIPSNPVQPPIEFTPIAAAPETATGSNPEAEPQSQPEAQSQMWHTSVAAEEDSPPILSRRRTAREKSTVHETKQQRESAHSTPQSSAPNQPVQSSLPSSRQPDDTSSTISSESAHAAKRKRRFDFALSDSD